MQDEFVIKERESLELFLRLLRNIADKDMIKAQTIEDLKKDRWEENANYFRGRAHGYLQAAEEVRGFFRLDDRPAEDNPFGVPDDHEDRMPMGWGGHHE